MSLPHEILGQLIPIDRINAWIDAINAFGGASISADGSTWTGVLQSPVNAQTTNYTALTTDGTIECNGTFAVALYAASGKVGRRLTVKNVGAGVITVTPNGADTIDGAASYVFSMPFQSMTFEVNAAGSGWNIVQAYMPYGTWIDVAFNQANFTTNSTGSITTASAVPYVYRYMVIGKTMWLNCGFKTTINNTTTTDLRVAIPGGYTAKSIPSGADENQQRAGSIHQGGDNGPTFIGINVAGNFVSVQLQLANSGAFGVGYPNGTNIFTGFMVAIPLA